MRRLAFTIPADALETVLDGLLPLVPQGVHPAPLPGGRLELAVYGDGPSRAELEAAVGPHRIASAEEDAPDDPDERRVRYRPRTPVAGRIVVRPSDAPPAGDGMLDVVIDSPSGAFGSGTHLTTTLCLELIAGLAPGGAFADLGCGAGVLAVTAALLGWDPVLAIEHDEGAVEATRRNAERNGVAVEAVHADLLQMAPPAVATIAANVPPAVHAHLAAGLAPDVERVIVSGIVAEHLDEIVAGYARAGLPLVERRGGTGWVAALVARDA